MLKTAKELLMLIPAFSAYYLTTEHLISLNQAEGTSMYPTLQDGQLILVQKTKFTPQKGDIIIAQSPIRPEVVVCKRVIYTENDVDLMGRVIPQNHIWIEGDNKDVSFDSRQHGPIPINIIRGKVLY